MAVISTLHDALDVTENHASPQARWHAFAELFARVGSPFLNMGEVDLHSGEITFFQSTMHQSWLDEYRDRNLVAVDPHVPEVSVGPERLSATASLTTGVTSIYSRVRPENGSDPRRYLDGQVQAGYDAVVGIPCLSSHSPRVRIVTLGATRGEVGFVKSEAFDALTRLAPLVALLAGPVERGSAQMVLDRRPHLTPRERDALCLLANGYYYARIAEKLNIAETTVRKYVISARIKLDCATREQAVAKAILMGLINP